MKLITLIISLVCAVAAFAAAPTESAADVQPKGNELTVSLITCYPGPEVYALCGHSAIRIRTENTDSVWNYGLFDFKQPNFVYRFVKGQTDYSLGAYPFAWFMPEYIERGSKVVEQQLNLSQAEAHKLQALLRREALPDRRTYRYNYVRDNCATRPIQRIAEAADNKIYYPDTASYGTFRREMRAYHANYPWYQFGIDLVLGSGLDHPIGGKEEMFAPVELMKRAGVARFADGRPLVAQTQVLYQGRGEQAVLPPTPWWLSPLAVGWAVFAIALITAAADLMRRKCTRIVYSLYWLATGCGGCIVWFLVLCSSHEATSPNLLMWWLNPLMLIAGITVWVRPLAIVTDVLAWVQGVLTAVVLLMWPFQPQVANPAAFPLMGSAVALAAAYAINFAKGSYKIEAALNSPAPSGVRKSGRAAAATKKRTSRR